MGNSRHGRALRPRDGGGTGTPASGCPAVLALEASSGTSKTAMDAPLLPRRSGRIAPAPSQERASAGLGTATRPRSKRHKNGAVAEGARLGVSTMTKNRALGSLLTESDRSAGSTKGAEEQVSANAGNGNASTSLKKRKVTNSRSYIKRFKAVQGANAAGIMFCLWFIHLLAEWSHPARQLAFMTYYIGLGTLLSSCIVIMGLSSSRYSVE
jgi:hypothetical protein